MKVLNNRASVYGPKLSIQWSPAEDPYLRDMSLDETTILLCPMTEKNTNGKLKFDAVFADGIAKSKSTVEYYLLPDEENEEHHETDAKPLYSIQTVLNTISSSRRRISITAKIPTGRVHCIQG